MDSWSRSVNDRSGSVSGGTWSPSAGLVGVAWTGAVAVAVWCTQLIGTADVPGLLLAAAATVGLVVAALYGTRARPRLRADADGVAVRGLTTRTVPWSQIRDVRAQAVRGARPSTP